jgi:serine/threonine protein kinase
VWDNEWRVQWAHTVIRECLLLQNGYGVPFKGLCVSSGVLAGLAMPLAQTTIDKASKEASYGQILQWVRDILEQLQRLHSAGFVHADVKSRNILVFEDRACLCDFGLSVSSGASSHSNAFTVNYRPPELLKGDGAIESSGDIWALGITVYECLFEEFPGAGTHWPKVVLRDVYDRVPDDATLRRMVFQKKLGSEHPLLDFLTRALSYTDRPTASALLDTIPPSERHEFLYTSRVALSVPRFKPFSIVSDYPVIVKELSPLQIKSIKSVSSSLCALLQLNPAPVTYFALQLSRLQVPIPELARVCCSCTIAILLFSDSLKLEYAARLCHLALHKFENYLDTVMIAAILNPDWASSWVNASLTF